MDQGPKSFLSSRESGRTEYTINRRDSTQHTRCISLLRPFLMWKVVALVVIIILYIVDLTSGNSKYSCQHSVKMSQGSGSNLQSICTENFLPVGLTIAIMVLEILVTIPKFPFFLIAFSRIIQVTAILFLKYTIQQQLYHQFIDGNLTPAYYGYAMLCGLVLADLIVDNRGIERKHQIFAITFVSVISFTLMVTEICINIYQGDMLLVEVVIMFGPVGLFLLIYNAILFNCFTTVLEHSLDPRFIALIIIAGPLTYILVSVSKVIIAGMQLGILITGILMYTCTFTAWCLTVPKVREKTGETLLSTVQVVRMQRTHSDLMTEKQF